MQESAQQHWPFWAVGFPIYFVGLWVGVSALISLAGGWWGLAKRYRTERTFPAHKRSLQRGQMRAGTGYNGVLTLASDAEGLYLGVMFLFRVAHPPLFIPWSEIEIEEPKRWLFFLVQRLRLGPDRIPLQLRERLAQFLLSERPVSESQRNGIRWGI